MTFDGFEATSLIETQPLPMMSVPIGPAEGSTLQGALAELGLTTAPDLWRPVGAGAGSQDFGDLGVTPLRPLSPDEMLLLAGNNVTVTGNPPDDWWDPSLPNDPYPGGGGGGGGGSGQNPNQQTLDANDTPCVDQVPQGVDLDHLNDLAKFSAMHLGNLQDQTGWEWGVFIYRGTDGQLYQSEPFTAQHPNDLNGATVTLPHGVHIVGYVHTHPVDNDMDERNLSDDDRSFISNIIGNGIGSVTVDSNMLAYVSTKDRDMGLYYDNYRAYVYDKSQRNSSAPGCQL
jgi:hypothetical protein